MIIDNNKNRIYKIPTIGEMSNLNNIRFFSFVDFYDFFIKIQNDIKREIIKKLWMTGTLQKQ